MIITKYDKAENKPHITKMLKTYLNIKNVMDTPDQCHVYSAVNYGFEEFKNFMIEKQFAITRRNLSI